MEAYVAGIGSYIGVAIGMALLGDAIADYRAYRRGLYDGDIEVTARTRIVNEAMRFTIQIIFATLVTLSFMVPEISRMFAGWALAFVPILITGSSIYSYAQKRKLLKERDDQQDQVS
jgi:purine-cytosine permease-like protein